MPRGGGRDCPGVGEAVSEKKIFENGGRRTDDGRTPDHGHPISSPCEPNGSGELKTKALISFAITAKLICVFVFAYADCWFPDVVAHF